MAKLVSKKGKVVNVVIKKFEGAIKRMVSRLEPPIVELKISCPFYYFPYFERSFVSQQIDVMPTINAVRYLVEIAR